MQLSGLIQKFLTGQGGS